MPLVAAMQCESCGQPQGQRHRATEPRPTDAQISAWIFDSVCDATDGCQVEPDGTCEHGHQSWLLRLGLI